LPLKRQFNVIISGSGGGGGSSSEANEKRLAPAASSNSSRRPQWTNLSGSKEPEVLAAGFARPRACKLSYRSNSERPSW